MKEYNFYNENYYLFPFYGSESNMFGDALHGIYSSRDASSLRKEQTFSIYKEEILLYKEYIATIANFIYQLDNSLNPISYSLIIHFLLKIGYFSCDDNYFKLANPTVELFSGYWGLQITKGFGCCRHIASFYKDLFDELNLYNEKMFCHVSHTYSPKDAYRSLGSHVINIICFNNLFGGYDMTKNIFYRFRDDLTLESMFKDNILYMYNKPCINVIIDGMSIDEMLNRLDLYGLFKGKSMFNYQEFLSIYSLARQTILENEKLLLSFRSKVKTYAKKIASK